MPGIVIVKSAFEMSKKMFPTASTLIRAFFVGVFGTTTLWEPSFAVDAASTYGYVCPPSTDSEIFTLAVEMGAALVPATFHVTVCVEPAAQFAGEPVTRNGPAV